MPQFWIFIIFTVILAIVAYFTGGSRPGLGVLGAGLLLVLLFTLGGVVHL